MRRARAPIVPRLLTAEQAAEYLGYQSTAALKRIPVEPVQLAAKGPGSAPKYDRHALDAWLDTLSGFEPTAPAGSKEELAEEVYATWKAQRRPR